MAFIYSKKDPSSGQSRWYARLKVGGKLETISLRLVEDGNKRLAERRAQKLQFEADAGSLSEETRIWLGTSAVRLSTLVARSSAEIKTDAVGVEGWLAAFDSHLKAMETKDTKRHVPGKAAKDEEYTLIQRMMTLRRFVRWTEDNKIKFHAATFTDTMIDFLRWRGTTVGPGTLWTKDYSYLCSWGDWMAKRGLCERPNRDRVKESLPQKIAPNIKLIGWREDLESLRYFRDNRIKSWKGRNHHAGRGWFSLWSLVAIVRGTGCRPSEATRLTWQTVDLEGGKIRFLKSKTGGNRTVPILYQWLHDAMVEIRDLTGDTGPVCKTVYGTPFLKLASACALMNRFSSKCGRTTYHLKMAQKLQLNHLIRMGFPPHVISKWSDHSLSMQERHYMEEQAYFPPDAAEDYEEFGVLTPFGQKVKDHLSGFSKDLDTAH